MGKWEKQQKLKEDKNQLKFSPKNPSFLSNSKTVRQNSQLVERGELHCPFCLHKDPIERYLISTPKGFDKRLVKCPECNQQFLLKTLIEPMTPEQYAEFLYGYRMSGGWQKVRWTVWKQRMNELRIAERFWLRYKELKGEDKTESYEEYIERKQREEYESGEYDRE